MLSTLLACCERNTSVMQTFDNFVLLARTSCRTNTQVVSYLRHLNPLRAKFLGENINIYLYFMSLLHTGKTQVVEIPP